MSRIGMIVPVWLGHLNPMTTLGRELQRRGHDVVVLSFADAAARIAKAGLPMETIGANAFPPGEWDHLTERIGRMHGAGAAFFMTRWVMRMMEVMHHELPEALARLRLDGVVMDQTCYGADSTVELLGLPLIVACSALPLHFQPDVPFSSETWGPSNGAIALFRNWLVLRVGVAVSWPFFRRMKLVRLARGQSWNVWEQMNATPPSLAHIAQLPACLDFPRRHAPEYFHHTGPWHEKKRVSRDGFDWNWLDGRPLVYASLGTLQNGLDRLYRTILDACAELPVQVVLALGRETGAKPDCIPPNARVLGYAPQLALLEKAGLVITHAGLNTTLESLAHGLPLVALPIAHEQPGIAARIKHAGVGEFLSIRRVTAAKLRAAVLQVQRAPSYRARARACACEIERANGLSRAAEIAEQAIAERRRVLRAEAGQALVSP